jgi:hypothetical protein
MSKLKSSNIGGLLERKEKINEIHRRFETSKGEKLN